MNHSGLDSPRLQEKHSVHLSPLQRISHKVVATLKHSKLRKILPVNMITLTSLVTDRKLQVLMMSV